MKIRREIALRRKELISQGENPNKALTIARRDSILQEENRKLKEALNEIRFRTYSRDTDDEILDQIKNTLTENGFPYQRRF